MQPPAPLSPLPLFLAQTLALRARKAWAAGGLAPTELEAAAGLFVRCCCGRGGEERRQQQQQQHQQHQQQVGTQLGLALCAGVLGCPRVAPAGVFGEAVRLVERAAAGVGEGVAAAEEARLRLLQLLPEEALRSRYVCVCGGVHGRPPINDLMPVYIFI